MDWENVFFLGGSPCAGKSSTAEILKKRFDFHYVRLDDRLGAHLTAASHTSQPTLARIAAASCDELWLIPPRSQTRRMICAYEEEFPLHLGEIDGLPRPFLLEGAALLPHLIAAQSIPPQQAVFLIPSSAFQRFYYSRRGWPHHVVKDCADPTQAFENWMHRDELFARWLRRQAIKHRYPVILIDGSREIDAIADQVADHLGWASSD